jgi:thiamine biosynthesis protein ThiC
MTFGVGALDRFKLCRAHKHFPAFVLSSPKQTDIQPDHVRREIRAAAASQEGADDLSFVGSRDYA